MKRLFLFIIALMFLLAMPSAVSAFSTTHLNDEPKKKDKKDKDDSASKKEDADEDDDSDADDEKEDTDEPVKKEPARSEKPKAKPTTKEADKPKDKEAEKAKKTPTVKRLMVVKLDQFLIPARAINLPLPGRTKTVRDLLERFDKWTKDDEVGAVLLDLDGINLGLPDIEELRAGLVRLKASGKKINAFLNSGDDMGYLLACLADEVAIAPTGNVGLPGLGRIFPFMRGMYQLQGIEYEVITAGRFKYPGFMNAREPNKYFQQEMNEIFDCWYDDYVKFIVDGRKLSPEAVKGAIDVALFDAMEAKNRGLVDVVAYYDEYCDRVVKRSKFRKVADGESDFSNITSLNDVLNAWNAEVKRSKESYLAVGPKIAVLHARGPIIDMNLGAGFSSSLIMRDEFIKSIEEIRKNKTIQAVVLRIDSPGGSGYASDAIWKKLRELDEEKPLVVSMGTVAGSGGYYIACPARLIYAEPTTITGSIGVLAVLPNMASMLNRMDVNLMELKRGERSLFGSPHRDIAPNDREFLQKYLLDFYEIFLDRVAATRKMPKDEVRKIAEGRIYTGRQAIKIGLVDRLGTLQDAISAAREMANIPPSSEIKLVHYPRPSSIGELLFEGLGGVSIAESMVLKGQQAAPVVSFDNQLQMFSRRPQPLCWMAMPAVEVFMQPYGARNAIEGLLGKPDANPFAPLP
jgi:protease IV